MVAEAELRAQAAEAAKIELTVALAARADRHDKGSLLGTRLDQEVSSVQGDQTSSSIPSLRRIAEGAGRDYDALDIGMEAGASSRTSNHDSLVDELTRHAKEADLAAAVQV